jgi:hypothetical protein
VRILNLSGNRCDNRASQGKYRTECEFPPQPLIYVSNRHCIGHDVDRQWRLQYSLEAKSEKAMVGMITTTWKVTGTRLAKATPCIGKAGEN